VTSPFFAQARTFGALLTEGLYGLMATGVFVQVAGYFVLIREKHLRTWLYVAVGIPVVLLLWQQARHLPWRGPLVQLAIWTPAYLGLTAVWAEGNGWMEVAEYLKTSAMVTVFIIGVILVQARYPRFQNHVLAIAAGLGAGHALLSLGFLVQEHGFDWPRLVPLGLLGHEIRGAMVYGAVALIAFGLLLRTTGGARRVAYGLAGVAALTAMVATQSRGPLIALVIGVTLLFLISRRWSPPGHGARLLWVALGVALAVATVASWDSLLSRGLSYRDDIWRAVLPEIEHSFWFGRGIGENSTITITTGEVFVHAHNFILCTWRFAGVVGVALVLLQVTLALGTAWRRRQGWPDPLWGVLLAYGCLCLLTNGQYPLARPTQAWFVYWVPIAFLSAACTATLLQGYTRPADTSDRRATVS
jgi:O-antigen ligase